MVIKAFRLTETAIRRYLRRFIASDQDIDDICQEAVTRALEAAQNKSIKDPKGFLFGVARNVMRKELDKKSRSLVVFINDFCPDIEASPLPSVEHSIDGNLSYQTIVKKLPFELDHKRLIAIDNQRVIDGIYHIQTLNNWMMRWKQWLNQFNGVGTAYLDNYIAWFRQMEQSQDNDSWVDYAL